MRSRTLLTQVLAVNTLLVAITAFVAAVVARDRFKEATSVEGLLLIELRQPDAVAPHLIVQPTVGSISDYRLVQYDLAVGRRWAEEMLYPSPAGTVAASRAPE